MSQEQHQYFVYPEHYKLALFAADAEVVQPAIHVEQFVSITVDPDSITLICPEEMGIAEATSVSAPWSVLQLKGPFENDKPRELSKLSHLLREHQIEINVSATFDTDYLLIHSDQLDKAVQIMRDAGYKIDRRS